MLLATVPQTVVRRLARQVPTVIRDGARSAEIETCPTDTLGADDWISCKWAWPHHDDVPCYSSTYFLTLTVRGHYAVGDGTEARNTRSPFTDHLVPPGTLFVIDPRVTHWLRPQDLHSGVAPGWIGLQWLPSRRRAKQRVQRIVRDLGGRWSEDMGRYEMWRPQQETDR